MNHNYSELNFLQKKKMKISAKTCNYSKNLRSDIPLSSDSLNSQYKLPISECIFYYLCCKQNKKTFKKIKFYRKAREIIDNYLDISNIILLNQQIETLKIILLNPNEIEIFDNIYRHSFNKKIGIDILPSRPNRDNILEEIKKLSDSIKSKRILNFIE